MKVHEDGYALILVFIMLTIFALLFPAILRLSITEFVIAKNLQEGVKDYYLIEGVVNLGTNEIHDELEDLIIDKGYISTEDLQSLNKEESLEIFDNNHNLIIKYKILEIVDESSKININTASREMLKSLNGVGDTIADDIIAKREFNTVEELSQVSGIGEIDSETYNQIEGYITVRSDGRININTASILVLESLSGIGDTLAENIKVARPFANKEDINGVDGIGEVIYSNLEDKIKVTSHSFKVILEISVEDKGIKRKITRFIELE
jgi:competence protein ComEA